MSDSGIGAMVHVACWLTDRLEIEVLSIGRSAHGVEDCVLEVVGTWLAYGLLFGGDGSGSVPRLPTRAMNRKRWLTLLMANRDGVRFAR